MTYSMMNPLKFAQRFKHRAYIFLPSLLAVSALFLSLESSESRAQPADGTQTVSYTHLTLPTKA